MTLQVQRVSGLQLERSLGGLRRGAFGRLTAPSQTRVLAACTVHHVPANSLVHERVDARGAWLGVVSGALGLIATSPGGRAITLDLIAPGEFFGDDAAVRDGFDAPELRALSACRLLVLRSEARRQLMLDEQELGPFFVQALSQRLRATHRWLTQCLSLSLEERVLARLLDLGHRAGVEVDGEVRIEAPLSQQAIADLVGCSRQRLNLVLRQLSERGVLRVEPRARHVYLRGAEGARLASGSGGHAG